MMAAPTVKLNSGHQMPLVGQGLWRIDRDTCADQVYDAIKAGVRLFDGACDYGNEKEAGAGVCRAIKDGLVKREDLFIATKLWNSFHDKEVVQTEAKKQLSDWGLDYFDLFYMHFPVSLKYVDPAVKYPPGWTDENNELVLGNATIQETWQEMEKLVDKGLAKSLGISNFNAQLIMDLLRYARIRPAVLQVELHPYLVQPALVRYAQENGIQVTAYSSFGPGTYHQMRMKNAEGITPLLEHSLIQKIAEKHGKALAQVILRWATQRGLSIIPRSDTPERLQQNFDVFGWNLDNDEMSAISSLDKGIHFNDPPAYGFNVPVFA